MRRKNLLCPPKKKVVCGRKPAELNTYEDIVAAYIRDHCPGAAAELQGFREFDTLEEVIHRAAWCMTISGKRHPHHYRRSEVTLAEAEESLLARSDDLLTCKTFDDLYQLIWEEIHRIKWIKRLYAYDVATWIGAKLKLEPELIYLHTGAGEGAKALGFSSEGTLDPKLLDIAFQELKPYEIEDCLCIFKDDLKRIASSCGGLFS